MHVIGITTSKTFDLFGFLCTDNQKKTWLHIDGHFENLSYMNKIWTEYGIFELRLLELFIVSSGLDRVH